jgi:hypothetical protein
MTTSNKKVPNWALLEAGFQQDIDTALSGLADDETRLRVKEDLRLFTVQQEHVLGMQIVYRLAYYQATYAIFKLLHASHLLSRYVGDYPDELKAIFRKVL